MTEKIAKGSWVEIHAVVLKPGERAPQVPDDTQAVPLEMRAKGFLVEAAAVGEAVSITTAADRRLTGTLVAINPPYAHGFGSPIPELLSIGREVRALLREPGGVK
ncbi:MAG: 2-amino-4-ketopentanoate thiolase [Rhodospirillales bacterium]|nr:2-amino-4-ketopentanoate thiolase [Rhodospirillales bacterium]